MPSSLVTDWKCVAQSGHTIDGRIIKPEWLTDMAETYDPAVYTAKLWIDHMRYASYGSVRALKVEKDGDVIRLYARISPSRTLLQMNQVWEEKLHFSIEPQENFAKTGKTYLVGLAMTDMPASLGTEEMRFAQITGRDFSHRLPGEPVPDLRDFSDDGDVESFFKRLIKVFQTNKQDEQGETSMEKEQFDKLSTGIDTLNQAMGTVIDAMKTFTAGPGKDSQNTQTPDAGKETTPPSANDQFTEKFTELTAAITGLKEDFGTIKQRLEAVAKGTEFQETHQPAEDEGII